MSDRAYAKAQVQQNTLVGSSSKQSLLQRTCACGQHTLTGGECSTCRSEKSALLRSQRAFGPSPAPLAAQGNALAQENSASFNPAFDEPTRFVHDFTRIPIHSLQTSAPQTKLKVDKTGDAYEREADQVAEQVTRMPEPELQRTCSCGGECPKCQTKQLDQEHERLHTKRLQVSDTGQIATPPIVHEVLAAPGHPLDPATRAFMEPRFEHDFSGVRIHTDTRAAEAAEAVNAQAYTIGHDIVFGAGRYAPGTDGGRRLLAHELTHTLQQSSAPQIQRKLTVDPNLPVDAPAKDPSASLTPRKRFDMMNTLIKGLCPRFQVDSTGTVVSSSAKSLDRAALAAGSNSTGCCCLGILTDTAQQWTIEVSSVIGAHTDTGAHLVFLNPTNTPVEFGSFTATSTLAFQGPVPAAGHELCGHAALEEVHAHPTTPARLTTDVHDPTVRIENQISQEQGVPASKLRGLAASGPHRGESVDKITISNFPINGTDVPSSEQSKIQFAAQYIFTKDVNDEYVSILGHSDSTGSSAVKRAESDKRAQKVKNALVAAGVPPQISKHDLPGKERFTSVTGVSDSQPPPPPLDAMQANWRRVEILMSSYPAGALVPPPGTPTTVTPHIKNPKVPALKASSDPCIKKLVGEAYP